jgi:hypothetical protein
MPHFQFSVEATSILTQGDYGFLNPNSALSIDKIRELISLIHDIIALFIESPEPKIPGIKCSHCGHDLKFVFFVKPEPRGRPG